MYLKSLEIQGFKSFPDKTKLNFDRGITAVVGPNGSGKSNIADAVRWVLGEQSAKTLRGGRMEDVIFGGTQKRGSVGYAQVSIIIDNSDHILDVEADEVIITRKYYRSGESEYKINKNNVRLRDIREMLMDTGLGRDGYSMIGQGKIAEIVSVKSTERREIFEEAAGITKYRYRKEQSEHQLEMAQENLIRLKDIIVEIEGRIEPLRIQSEKAKQFVELMNDKKNLEVSIFVHSLDDIRKIIREHENNIMICKANYDEIEEKISEIEKQTNHVYSEMNQISVNIDVFQKEKVDISEKITNNIAQIAVYKNDIFHKQENIQRLNSEISGFEDNKQKIDLNIQQKTNELKLLKQKIIDSENSIYQLEKQLTELINFSRQHSDEITQLTLKLNTLTKQLSDATVDHLTSVSSISEIQIHNNSVSDSLRERQNQLNELKTEQQNILEFSNELDKKIQEDTNTLNGYSMIFDNKQKKQAQIFEQLSGFKLKEQETSQRIKLLSDMENNMEDFSYSVKNVMKMVKQGELNGVYGPVSKLLNVPQKYALAIETALSAGIQNIVVDNEAVAKRAINLLKQRKAGRATFLPLTSIKGYKINQTGLNNFEGYIGVACDLVEFDHKYKNIIESLLGRIVLCETLDDGVIIAKKNGYKFRIVTLDGQIINAGGSFTGGSGIKTAGLLTRRGEIVELQNNKIQMQSEIEVMQEKYNNVTNEVSKVEAEHKNWSASIKTLEEDKLKCDFRLESVNLNIVDIEKQVKQYDAELVSSAKRIDELREKSDKAQGIKSDLQSKIDEIENLLEGKDSGRQNLKENMDNLGSQINSLKIEKLSYEKDVINTQQFLDELIQRKDEQFSKQENVDKEILDFQQQITQIQDYSAQAEHNNSKLKEQISNIDNDIVSLNKNREDLEKKITGSRSREKELASTRENVTKDMTRLQERKMSHQLEYDQIIAKLWDEYELTVSEATDFCKPIDNLQKSKNVLTQIKTDIRNLGSVNVDSIEEYDEVKERYEYLSTQYKDVEDSKNQLIKLINELTSTMRDIFAQSFKEINANFKQIFKELFGGGEAELSLGDDQDVLQSGIDIFVQPPGKIIKNLSALSGGEQSFVAIAIYFAILKVRPAPFCLLDEIEAALDDVNVSKYASYLRKMTNNTQFIAISHRRGTMEEANALYGVTMQEEGISKLLRLELNEVETKLGI